MFGWLLFNAASAAAWAGSADRADDLLRAALAAAARFGVDRVEETGVFGPRVAAMQAGLRVCLAWKTWVVPAAELRYRWHHRQRRSCATGVV